MGALKMDFKKFFYITDRKTGVRRISKFKILISGLMLILFLMLLAAITIAIMFPITSLNIAETNIELEANQTECLINGTTEPGASVIINSDELDLENITVPVDSDGTFQYNLTVPKNINKTSVSITAKVDDKGDHVINLKISRLIEKVTQNLTNSKENKSSEETPKDNVLLDKGNVKLVNGDIYVDNQVIGTYSIVKSPPSVGEGVDKRTWKNSRIEIVDFAGSQGDTTDYYTQYKGQWVKLTVKNNLDRTTLELTDDIYTAMS